jgi:hypothetical protein
VQGALHDALHAIHPADALSAAAAIAASVLLKPVLQPAGLVHSSLASSGRRCCCHNCQAVSHSHRHCQPAEQVAGVVWEQHVCQQQRTGAAGKPCCSRLRCQHTLLLLLLPRR